jgi:hypothetical protein
MPLGPEATLTPSPGPQFQTIQPGAIQQGPATPQAPAAPTETRFYPPSVDSDWHPPANGSVRLAVPESAPPGSARESVRLYQPEPPLNQPQPAVREDRSSKPAVKEDRSPKAGADSMPVGIPDFAVVKEGITTGLRPSYLDGFNWLAARGYHTVLHLRQPNDVISTDSQQVERYGMKYMSLEVTPQSLKETLDQFNSIIGDAANHPLFVYDKDRMLAGSLWYLHFRTVERLANDKAQEKAVPLGLQVEQNESNRSMWLAIQKVLEQVR